jgi:phosphoglycolate phosphatase-like HAD superfamily hydrolase
MEQALDVEGVVFDLDATLIDLGGHVDWRKAQTDITEFYHSAGCSELVENCEQRGLFGLLDHMWVELVDDEGKRIQREAYEILSNYELKGTQSCTLMPSCMKTLDWIRERNIPMGICTSNSGESAKKALETQGLMEYFKAVVGRSSEFRMKPYPDQLNECLTLMRVDPLKSVMIGDSHKDILAGKAAGCYTIAIPIYFTRIEQMKEAQPDNIIESLDELPEILQNIRYQL